MIKFYRTLKPLYALTFDLDDTLYNNKPIITKAENKLISFLKSYHPTLNKLNNKYYQVLRKMLRQHKPEIYHNVDYWRWSAIKLALNLSGINNKKASAGADDAMNIMTYWRSKIDIPYNTHNILSALSSRWPLIAITNGNVNPANCGLDKYFTYILRAGVNGRAKPYEDMYHLAAKYLGISCKNILHIGDNLYTDILGAIQCGMQSCWINEYNNKKKHFILKKSTMPNIIVTQLSALTNLLL